MRLRMISYLAGFARFRRRSRRSQLATYATNTTQQPPPSSPRLSSETLAPKTILVSHDLAGGGKAAASLELRPSEHKFKINLFIFASKLMNTLALLPRKAPPPPPPPPSLPLPKPNAEPCKATTQVIRWLDCSRAFM